jgi:hypothetical protein
MTLDADQRHAFARARPSSSLRVARSSVPKASSWILLAIIRRNRCTLRLLGRAARLSRFRGAAAQAGARRDRKVAQSVGDRVSAEGLPAQERFIEFFMASMRNGNARGAYAQAGKVFGSPSAPARVPARQPLSDQSPLDTKPSPYVRTMHTKSSRK